VVIIAPWYKCAVETNPMLRSLIVALTFLASAAAGYADERNQVGVIVPLSGGAASYGQGIRGAFNLAAPTAYRPLFEDDQCEARKALTAYQALRRKNVRVFYAGCSGAVLVLAPLAKTDGTLILTAYAASTDIRATGPEVIRLNPDGISEAEELTDYLRAHYPNGKFSLLFEEQDYASSLAHTLEKTWEHK
jgi:ABC-type branched-subunit amino acid transport system substrate-binding protein